MSPGQRESRPGEKAARDLDGVAIKTSVAATLTKGERDDLQRVAKMRAKVERGQIEVREAELIAKMEADLCAIYPPNDPRWADITTEANIMIEAAKAKISEICRQEGIPAEFAPNVELGWRGRGENASKDRRAELRKFGTARIKAAAMATKAAIDYSEMEALSAIIADGLTSEAAQGFLQAIPQPAKLMAVVDIYELEAEALVERTRNTRQHEIYGRWGVEL